jgi:hypothetical protein
MKTTRKDSRADQADAGRRSFIRRMGAGMSVAAAPAVVAARPADGDDAVLRAALLQEEKLLRQLHQRFQDAVDKGHHDQVTALFFDGAEVRFNGGVFRGPQGIARFFREFLPARKAGVRLPVAPGFELPAEQRREELQVAADRCSATAVFPYSLQAGEPLDTGSSLASMARLHGEGVRTWWEGGHHRVAYVKDAEGRWKIARLEYDTAVRADWRPGRSYAVAMDAPRLAVTFPRDAQGPDALA